LRENILDVQEVKLRFKMVKKRFYFILLLTLVFFVGGLMQKQLGIDVINPFFSALIGVVVFNVGCFMFYRCPKCNAVPFAYGSEGVQLNPKSCSNCGVSLK
jgi:ascorbate-specific PTS system EIIC-type component UlaA